MGSLDLPFTVGRHLRLLLSVDRGSAVQRAVLDALRPGARVLDAGAGTGLLSFLAVREGAAEVVAVDREHLDLAEALAAENGCAGRVRFVAADLAADRLPDLGPPSRFDVLLAFIYTNHPLTDDGRARLVFALRDRYCTPDARIVPSGIRYRVTGCDRTDWDYHTELADLHACADALSSCYGLGFAALLDRAEGELALTRTRPFDPLDEQWRPVSVASSLRFSRSGLRLLTEPTPFGEVDYHDATCAALPDEVPLTVTSPGRLSGVLWTQDLRYAGRVLWSTESFSPLAEPVAVVPGDKLLLDTGPAWRRSNVVHLGPGPVAGR